MSLHLTPMPRNGTEKALDLFTLLLLGLLWSLAGYQWRSGAGWSAALLPLLGSGLAALLGYLPRSGWPVNLPFAIRPEFADTARRQVRLLLRLLNAWMLLLFGGIALLEMAGGGSLLLGMLMVTTVLVDLVLVLYFLMRLSRYSGG